MVIADQAWINKNMALRLNAATIQINNRKSYVFSNDPT